MRNSVRVVRWSAGLSLAVLMVAFGAVEGRENTPVPKPAALSLKDQQRLEALRKGQITPENKEGARALARLYSYSLAYYPVDGSQVSPEGKPRPANADDATFWISDFMRRFYILPTNANMRLDQANYLSIVSKAMDPELKLVFEKDPRTMVKLNSVRFMAEVARGPNAELAKTLLEITDEKLQPEAYKNYAYQGLRNLLLQRTVEDREKPLISDDDPKMLAHICNSLEAAVYGKDNRWAGQPADVTRFIRCRAVMALGAVPYSAVRIRKTEYLARPATALLRVALGEPSIQPSPSVNERCEAILGLCSMTIDSNMNLDVLAYGVNKAMLDLITFQGEQQNTKVSTLHWKESGARLAVAFDGWKKFGSVGKLLKNKQNPQVVYDLADRLKEVADSLESGGLDAKPAVTGLTDWFQNNRPTSEGTLLFKDDPNSKFIFAK